MYISKAEYQVHDGKRDNYTDTMDVPSYPELPVAAYDFADFAKGSNT